MSAEEGVNTREILSSILAIGCTGLTNKSSCSCQFYHEYASVKSGDFYKKCTTISRGYCWIELLPTALLRHSEGGKVNREPSPRAHGIQFIGSRDVLSVQR